MDKTETLNILFFLGGGAEAGLFCALEHKNGGLTGPGGV
jgi:hypothetical protein